ncbi:phage antirepressor N-terminal domain-containing protein [Pasteurella multocida]|uniref:phage antirepressor N-terminal domain-containing protein n=1 Tax=Pasteurella multocida TaxID=747 RepID=UPI0030D47C62
MTTQIQTINFHNQLLSTFEHNSIYYVAMKPICENIGLNWDGQRQRIQRDEVLSQGTVIITAPTNSGDQQMLCLPIDYLNGWLFGIDVKRVKPEIRDLLITYKKECYKALSDYWMKGKAERKTTTDERTGLRQAVSKLVSQKGLIYSDAYSLIHQRFNVQHIDELTPEQIPMAVEYIHKIVLEGELITDTSLKTHGILLDEEAFYVVAKAIAKLNESTFEWEKMMDLFSELESHRNYKTAFNLGVASYNLAQSSEKIIMKNLVQMRNKVWKKEIEDFIFSNPHLQNHTENKLVHYLR